MNWDLYKQKTGIENEFEHLSFSWNADDEIELDFSDIDPSEIIYIKESDLLTTIWNELDALLLKIRSNLTAQQLKDNSFILYSRDFFSDEEAMQCKDELFKFYTLCRNALARKLSWLGFASFFDELSGLTPLGNRLISFVENPRFENLIQIEINTFIQSAKEIILFSKVLKQAGNHSTLDICDNLILYSNEDIMLETEKIKGNGMRHNRIDLLFRVREILNRDILHSSNFWFSFSAKGKLFPVEREYYAIVQWIDKSLYELMPSIFCLKYKNSDQKEKLRAFFSNQIEDEKLVIRDGDVNMLINTRFYKAEGKNPFIPSSIDFDVLPGQDTKPSELISDLSKIILQLNSDVEILNSRQDIQYWIYNLFVHFKGKGFSFSHVKKITESKVRLQAE